jgi:hypothetical protein
LLDEWTDVIWYVVVTMTTIGYGDRVAKTTVTRAIVILLLIWGNLWSSIFISVLFPYVNLSLFEEKALNQYQRTVLRQKIQNLSQKVISNLVKINFYSKDKNKKKKDLKKMQLEIFSVLREIKELKEKINTLIGETNNFIDEILGNLK